MHSVELILTLSAGLIAALILGYATHRLGWSPIVGYLLAGVLLGPHTPGFVANRELANQLAEIGVILLMFGVGLHFRVKDLLAVKTIAIVGALVQSAVATLLGAAACVALGWSWSSGIVFGLALSVASTVVLTRVLADNNQLQSVAGRIAVGWLIMEDILTVFVLVLLPAIFASTGGSIWSGVAIASLKIGVFVALILVVGAQFIPWALRKIAATHSRELFTLGVLAIALGIAVSSTHFFGVSMALGAFLAGVVVGQSDFSARAGSEALPMRDAFAVMFFMSVGMMLEPRQILAQPLLTLTALGVVLLGKPLAAFVIVRLLGYRTPIAASVALSLAQIGEFSFLLAVVGRQLGVLPEAAMNPLVSTAMLSIVVNPFLYRRLSTQLSREPQTAEAPPQNAQSAQNAIVVGYGPVGKTITRLLRRRGIEPTVIDMNDGIGNQMQEKHVGFVSGDANDESVLRQAGIVESSSIIFSASGSAHMTAAIATARRLNPSIHIVVRADYVSQTPALLKSGVDEVFSDEGEVALTLISSILKRLGATPAQLSEERERTREDLR